MLIQVARLRVVPTRDCVAPPVTSKVLKYCLGGVVPRRIVGGFANASISMLFDGSRALYSTEDCPGPLVLKGGREYTGRVSVVDPSAEFLGGVTAQGLDSFACSSPYGEFHISIQEIEVVPLESLDVELPRVFKVVFHTPTILSSKLMSPPPLAGRVGVAHKLIPQPSFIFSHLLRMWNSIAPPEGKLGKPSEWAPYILGRQADITVSEVDYRVRAVTAIVGRDGSGRLRKARGFTGWVIYRSIARPSLHRIFARLLALAGLVGVGRSRGIGFGHVSVEVPEPPGGSKAGAAEGAADSAGRNWGRSQHSLSRRPLHCG